MAIDLEDGWVQCPGPIIISFASMATGASGDIALERRLLGVLEQAFHIWCERHRKYKRKNISRGGARGCLQRLIDKISRLETYYFDGGSKEEFTDESLVDTWIDAINYPAMGLMCELGQWDKD